MTSFVKNFATSSNLLFVAAIALGLLLPQAAYITFYLMLPAFTVILTVSLFRFPLTFFHKPKKLVPATLLGNLMNYIILGNIILLGSIFLIRDENIWIGMVLIAAMPPAVCILSLSDKINVDKLLTLGGFAGTYVAAIILSPLIGVAFLKFIPMSYTKLIVLVLSLIALPLIFSRIATDHNWDGRIVRRAPFIVDGCYFIIYYTLAAHNAALIRKWPIEILLLSVIALVPVLAVYTGFFFIRKLDKFDDSYLWSLVLLGTMKDYGLAGVIALYVFGNETALPALIFSIFMFLYCAWLKSRQDLQILPATEDPESAPLPEHQ